MLIYKEGETLEFANFSMSLFLSEVTIFITINLFTEQPKSEVM